MQKLFTIMQRNPLWQRAKIWYELLEVKDRKIIQVLSAVVCCALVYLLVWEPVNNWTNEQESGYLHQLEVGKWLQNNKSKAMELQSSHKSGVGQRELSSVVGSVARKSDVTLSRVQPDRKGLSVWVEDTAYQKLLNWLVILETKHDIQIQQIRIDKLKEEGRVKGYIHFVN